MKEEQVDYMFSRIRELPSEVSLEQVQAVVTGAAAGTLSATTSLSGKVFAKTLLNFKFMSLMGIILTTTITLGLLFGGDDAEKTADGNTPDTGQETIAVIEETPVDSPDVAVKKIPAADTLRLKKANGGTTTVVVVNAGGKPATQVTVSNGTAYVYSGNEGVYAIADVTDSAGNTTTHVQRLGAANDTSGDPAVIAWSSCDGGNYISSSSCNDGGSSYTYCYSNTIGKKKNRSRKSGRGAGSYSGKGNYYAFTEGDSTVVTSTPSKNKLIPAIFTKELVKDKLISEKDDYISFQLTEKSFKVDGKKQPEEIFRKYLKLYEDTTGERVKDNFSYYYMFSGNPEEAD